MNGSEIEGRGEAPHQSLNEEEDEHFVKKIHKRQGTM